MGQTGNDCERSPGSVGELSIYAAGGSDQQRLRRAACLEQDLLPGGPRRDHYPGGNRVEMFGDTGHLIFVPEQKIWIFRLRPA